MLTLSRVRRLSRRHSKGERLIDNFTDNSVTTIISKPSCKRRYSVCSPKEAWYYFEFQVDDLIFNLFPGDILITSKSGSVNRLKISRNCLDFSFKLPDCILTNFCVELLRGNEFENDGYIKPLNIKNTDIWAFFQNESTHVSHSQLLDDSAKGFNDLFDYSNDLLDVLQSIDYTADVQTIYGHKKNIIFNCDKIKGFLEKLDIMKHPVFKQLNDGACKSLNVRTIFHQTKNSCIIL